LIEVFHYFEGKLQTGLTPSEIESAIKSPGFLWINLNGFDEGEIDLILTQLFNFHPLTIEDCRHVSKYPKTDSLAGYSFLIWLSPKTTAPTHAKIFMRELDIYLLPKVIVTFHREALQAIQRVRDTLAKDAGELLSKGPDFILHMLLDTIIDRYLTTAKIMRNRSRELEELISRRQASLDDFGEVLNLRYSSRALQDLARQSAGILRTFRKDAEHGLFGQESKIYFSDLDDHIDRIISSLARSIDRLESSQNLFVAGQSQKRNKLLGLLAMLASILLFESFCQAPLALRLAIAVAFGGILMGYFFWARKRSHFHGS
jgi:magnesium transporter